MGRHRRNNLPRHSPRRARPAAAADPAVRAEQEAMNKLLQKLYGPNARQLCVDGKAGPATNGVRELMDKAFRPDPAFPNESRLERMQRIAAGLETPAGQEFRNNPANAQAFNELQTGVDGLRESPNGFQPRTGPAPDPAAPVAAAPPAAPAAPEGPPAGPLPAPISGNIADFDVPEAAPAVAPSPAAIAGVAPAPAAPAVAAPPRM